tara:strand:+ start:433 stop:618 length:186 start_codon:yes stop_codon:yes gene_type:complete
MDTENNKNERYNKILLIKESYRSDMENIVSLANKLGWKTTELEEHPELLIHVFYEYLDIIK